MMQNCAFKEFKSNYNSVIGRNHLLRKNFLSKKVYSLCVTSVLSNAHPPPLFAPSTFGSINGSMDLAYITDIYCEEQLPKQGEESVVPLEGRYL